MDVMNREFQRLLVTSGWTQARAAQELRLDAATVSRYLGGTITPSETVLRLFGEILGERVVLPGSVMPPSMRESARHLEPYEVKAMESLRRITPEHRRKFCELISMMADVGQIPPDARDTVPASPPPTARAAATIRPDVVRAARKTLERELSAVVGNIRARRAQSSEPSGEPNAKPPSALRGSGREKRQGH